MSRVCAHSLNVSGRINNVRDLEDFIFLVYIAAAKEKIFVPIICRKRNFKLIFRPSLKKLSKNWSRFTIKYKIESSIANSLI
jgi:hypothetical protein